MRRHAKPFAVPCGWGASTLFAAGLILLLLCMTGPAVASSATCVNESVRQQQRATFLPECRAYEMATPTDKNHNDVAYSTGTVQSAVAGSKVAYVTSSAFADAEGTGLLVNYVASRGGDEWTTHSITSPQAVDAWSLFGGTAINWLSPELDSWVLTSKNPPLTPDANPTAANLYLRNATGYRLITQGSPETFLVPHSFLSDISSDLRHVLFSSSDPLTPEAPMGRATYQWIDGSVQLVSILPTGEATEGSPGWVESPGQTYADRTMSDDGERAVFATPDGQLYLRDGSETEHPSLSQAATPDPLGPLPAQFATASSDASVIYFRSRERLTDDSTACGACDPNTGGNEGFDMYRYDAANGTLTDITIDPKAEDTFGASVAGVLGASKDGSRLYFAAYGHLADAPVEASGPNLYLWRNGVTKYIGGLNPADSANWSFQVTEPRTSRLTDDGQHLLFTSRAQLSATDTEGHAEVYLYSDRDESISCISCRPDGAPSGGDASVSSSAPGTLGPYELHLTQNIGDDGQTVYFETSDSLLSRDGNGRVDVYRWHKGQVTLMSSGRSEFDSHFGDASKDGRDVFINTREQLVPRDTDDNLDIYDVRTDGGWEESSPAQKSECVGDACQPSPSVAPVPSSLGSRHLVGSGNSKRHRVNQCVKRRDGKASHSRARKRCGATRHRKVRSKNGVVKGK